ncbi:LysR family transcriptional regulator [Paraburkholderia caballeronis]|uniref:DNA-binding transcriptional regulator, LysR family n=1 Tax=Paraburkholderia caballeronis TaxID=416943 RepID=A0A1H7FP79_9BURK|nr:LysR family transcriptional regulator [Paraburkholderia caballeronis]PXW24895.1 LysR family transcriptional regulator [Paraburkholderia caballeronis]PXX00625.1 LysR family transcriptional regulator [Paraburkholderia caballeronis]RAJ98688.1 LysR family transcriptional regulator [Paraburkholderia caballeronis]SEE70132.1 transcriptional regulator, LysR family [Paraburkholderia caballeronis]SEK27779.1 DNA-binding transcriptional regulator, LysR family [Paraburkholderia caballeronis]
MLNRLEILKIFAVTAASPTFREAAKRLGVSPQVVTRAIRELEQTLGETLFHRSTRRIQITTFGQSFVPKAQDALAAVDDLFGPAASRTDEAVGTVRITAPSVLGRRFVQPVLLDLMTRHPGLVPDLRLSDSPSPVVDEQIDIGVRAGAIGDNRFIARMIGPLPVWVVGAPSLIGRVGEPTHLKELETMPVTSLIDRSTGRPWPWMFRDERQFQPSSPVFVTDDTEAEIAAACAGLGFSQCTEYLVRPCIADGRLVRLLPRLEPSPWKLYVYRPQRGPVPTRIRVVYDELVAKLGQATLRD